MGRFRAALLGALFTLTTGACAGRAFSLAPPDMDGGPEDSGAPVDASSADATVFGDGAADATLSEDAPSIGPDAADAATPEDAPAVHPDAADATAPEDAPAIHSDAADARAPEDAPAIHPDAADAAAPEDAPASGSDASGSDAPVTSHCASSYACVPAVPPNFTGPLELYVGSDAAPPCGQAFQAQTIDGNDLLSAPAATCGCACGPLQDAGCATPSIAFSTLNDCATVCANAVPRPGCSSITATSSCPATVGIWMTAAAPAVAIGSCPPVPTSTVTAAQWGEYARACAASVVLADTDCPTSTVCAPAPATPFGTATCVAQSGDVACPLTAYTVRHVYYGGVDDQRGCSACTCGDATGTSCSGSVDVYDSADASCTGVGDTYQLPFACDPINQGPADFRVDLVLTSGSCTPDAVSAIGAATPIEPTTFCCTP
jgi:hypothetical protein